MCIPSVKKYRLIYFFIKVILTSLSLLNLADSLVTLMMITFNIFGIIIPVRLFARANKNHLGDGNTMFLLLGARPAIARQCKEYSNAISVKLEELGTG